MGRKIDGIQGLDVDFNRLRILHSGGYGVYDNQVDRIKSLDLYKTRRDAEERHLQSYLTLLPTL